MAKMQKINYSQFIIISVIAFAIFLSNQMVVNTVTKYADTMGVSVRIMGLIGGIYGGVALLTRPFSGQVVDKERHKPLLFVCVLILIASNLLLIFAANWIFLLISRAVNGIAWGFGSTLCMTTACDALPKEKLASGIGIYTMTQTLAQVMGPSVALWLIENTSFRHLYGLTTSIMVAALVPAFFFKTGHRPRKDLKYSCSLRHMFALKAFFPASMLMCNTMQIAAVASFLLLYADEVGVLGLSFFFTLQAMAILLTRPFVSRYINHNNSFAFVIISELMIISGLVNLFFADTTVHFIISAILFGMGKSGAQPALTSMCVISVPENERGKASNTSYAFNDIGQFIGSYIAGIAASIWGYRYAFVSIGLIIAIGLMVFIAAYMIPMMKKNDNDHSDNKKER